MLAPLYRKLSQQEQHSPGWLGVFFNSHYLFRHGLHRAIQRHSNHLQGTVVDYGCGQKPYASLISAKLYLGLDVQISGHPCKSKSADIFFDGVRVPLRDHSVDSILGSEVFEHVFELDHTLRELNRILKDGGIMLLTCPFCWHEHETPYDFARYSSFGLAHVLKRAGFEILTQEKEVSFVPALFQMGLLYCTEHLRPERGGITALLGVIYNGLFNLGGILFEKLLPVRWDFYLANVVLVRKSPPDPAG